MANIRDRLLETNISDLIPRPPGLVADYMPRLKYLLIDENAYCEADLAALKNLVAAVIRFEHPVNSRALVELIDLLNDWLDGNPELKRIFAIWIRVVLLRHSKYSLVLPKVTDLKELKMSLTDRLDSWAKEHEEKGLEKGLEKGEALALQRLLVKRFGALPPEYVARIGAASGGEIEAWLDRVLDACSLDAVFGPPA
ncbi:MAG: DUF4351 domain-containing protein [Candidatus Accumulibacter sp. UW20]